ncbi:pheromone processing endoprotease [Lunasporangiospora selenospora]|uniref:Pheromone processing endoprotease n=1 Tax=Lunasporangiospora selenospora TaxID=979761 RepID=A0A9P6G3V7_9FUNG|nr:pheromone processing endoprotease [Lunasporangiospora selenospora]
MPHLLKLVSALSLISAIFSPCLAARPSLPQDHAEHHYYIIRLNDPTATPPQDLAHHLGVEYIGQVGELFNYHLFSYPKTTHEKRSLEPYANATTADIVIERYGSLQQSQHFQQRLAKRSSDLQSQSQDDHLLGPIQKQQLRRRVKRGAIHIDKRDEYIKGEPQPADAIAAHFQIQDPGFTYQWHLHNTIQTGNDLNVTGVWDQGITGKGAIVAIIDDGLDANSEDLAPNFYAKGSHDFNDNVDIPLPRLYDDNHGTRCAGEIAASRNDLCGVGVAWDAKVAGLRILSGAITDVQEAEALNYNYEETQIYSCSWGPTDDGEAMDGPNGLLLDAFINGVTKGRQGKGSIFVFATGNGGRFSDNCNFDGYTNSRYTVSIGAISRTNRHPVYSEACSAQLGVTYSSGDDSYIYTCDVGQRNCFGRHSGTSAAAPLAAAIYALALEVRPELNWRDVQYLTVHTAVPMDLEDSDWKETATKRMFNHKYGYGKLDAYRIVEAAKTWVSVGQQVSHESPVIKVDGEIPSMDQGEVEADQATGISSIHQVTKEDLEASKFGTLEHITVTVNIRHQRRGEVEVELESPNKVISKLAVARPRDASTDGFSNWTFMTVKHWEENPVGRWTLTVYDRSNPNNTGVFVDWKLSFHGEIVDGHSTAPVPTPVTPQPQPTTAPAIPQKTSVPDKPENSENQSASVSPIILIMFGGMIVAIAAALFVMYRQRNQSRGVFRSLEDEEAGQRGGLLGRRGDYEFNELPTHDLGGSDDDDEDDDDGHHRRTPISERVLFERDEIEEIDAGVGAKELKDSHHPEGSGSLSSGEEIERESSFEMAAAEDDEYDTEGGYSGRFGGSGSTARTDGWDEVGTMTTKNGKQARR